MKVYIAGPLFTPQQQQVVTEIRDALILRGVKTFSPFHNSQNIFKGRKPADCPKPDRDRVLTDNIINLDWCDVLLAWVGGMGGFTDPGVIWEMGYATKAGKFVAAYVDDSDDRQSMNLMLAGTVSAFIKGRENLKLAMEYMRDENSAYAALHQYFNPELELAQDREPVV